MKTFMYSLIVTLALTVGALRFATGVSADAALTPTKTPTPTPTATATATATPKVTATVTPQYIEETRVECENGAYGQQTCKTVVYRRLASDEGKTHTVVKTGLEENIMIGLLALFAGSTLGYVYMKQ